MADQVSYWKAAHPQRSAICYGEGPVDLRWQSAPPRSSLRTQWQPSLFGDLAATYLDGIEPAEAAGTPGAGATTQNDARCLNRLAGHQPSHRLPTSGLLAMLPRSACPPPGRSLIGNIPMGVSAPPRPPTYAPLKYATGHVHASSISHNSQRLPATTSNNRVRSERTERAAMQNRSKDYIIKNRRKHWELKDPNSQRVLKFQTSQQAIDAGKAMAAPERRRVAWFDEAGVKQGEVDYRPRRRFL